METFKCGNETYALPRDLKSVLFSLSDALTYSLSKEIGVSLKEVGTHRYSIMVNCVNPEHCQVFIMHRGGSIFSAEIDLYSVYNGMCNGNNSNYKQYEVCCVNLVTVLDKISYLPDVPDTVEYDYTDNISEGTNTKTISSIVML